MNYEQTNRALRRYDTSYICIWYLTFYSIHVYPCILNNVKISHNNAEPVAFICIIMANDKCFCLTSMQN